MIPKIEYLTKDSEIRDYLKEIHARNYRRIAIDLEGDQGSVHYKNSISIIQVWDGTKAYIFDVQALDKHDALIEFLTSKKFTKIMFACTNDLFMTQNTLNCTIEHIRDIAVAQKMLNQSINLAKHIGIDKKEKDSLQRANWVIRPIADHLIEYAINDVLDLIRLEDDLINQLVSKNKYLEYQRRCDELSRTDYRIDPLFVYSRRIGTYKHMNPKQKEILRTIWIMRELIGEHLDKPVGLLYSKKAFPFWVRKAREIDFVTEVFSLVNKKLRPEKRLNRATIQEFYEKAAELAAKAPH